MKLGLETIRRQCTRASDAIRWACILEATAPKVGNVYPGRDFQDLSYLDFVAAAQLSASAFESPPETFSHGVLSACHAIAEQCGTNVNLGILLLLGPLAHADSVTGQTRSSRNELRMGVVRVLTQLGPDDATRLYAAINVASPGGMGETDDMDLNGPPPNDFIQAMTAARNRDRIARNYANGFSDLFDQILPVVEQCISEDRDVLAGVSTAHLRLLETEPDTLIARKFGQPLAEQVQQKARFDHSDLEKRDVFDRYLRIGAPALDGHVARVNPGTTADLIAAALYILLRERTETPL